jgi:RNA recognition motif-containing protein
MQRPPGLRAGKLHGFGFVQFDAVDAAERACQLHGSIFMGRELTIDVATSTNGGRQAVVGKPVEGCWFCLSNPNADVNLVASIGQASNWRCSCSQSLRSALVGMAALRNAQSIASLKLQFRA